MSGKKNLIMRLIIILITFPAFCFMSACGGGSGGSTGGTSASITTGTEVFTGTDTNAGNAYPVTVIVNPLEGTYGVVSSSGNQTSGSYTLSGSTVSINSGSDYLNPCTSSSCTILSVNQSNLTLSGTSLSGKVTLSNGASDSLSLTAPSAFNQSSIASLNGFFGKTFNPPVGSGCGSSVVGSSSYAISGSTLVVSCSYNPSNYTKPLTMCTSLGADCSPGSFLTSHGITIPSTALVFYISCTSTGCPSVNPYSAGYINQSSAGSNTLSIHQYELASTMSSSCPNTLLTLNDSGFLFEFNNNTYLTGDLATQVSPSTVNCSGTIESIYAGGFIQETSGLLF